MTMNETDNKEELGKDTTNNESTSAGNKNDETSESLTEKSAPADAPLQTPEELLKAEVSELNDKYLRLYSEFDNMKRRNAKERIELMQTAGKDVLLALLPVADDFERAMKSFENTSDVEALKNGIQLIHNKFLNILNQKGLKAVESVGKDFDVDYHEAITKIPAPTPDLKGKVVDEVEKGYTLNDKVIRFAKVVVGE